MKSSLRVVVKPVAILLAAMPLPSQAQEAKFSTMVISAPKVEAQPAGTAVVDAAGMASLRPATSDTASLLRDIPGVSLYGAGGVSSLPTIHGLADDRVRVKVDGMDLVSACANHMNSPLSYIDPTSVGSVKVLAGIAPVSMGGDSIGGTIEVNSAPPEFAAAGQAFLLKGEAGVFYRSNGNAKGGNFAAVVANETLSMTYRGSTAQSDNYKAAKDFKATGLAAAGRDWMAGDVVGSSMYKSTNQALGFAFRHENHLVELKLGVQDIPYQGFPNQRMDMTGNDSTQINLRYRGQFEWGALDARVYDEKTRHKMQFGDDKLYWYGPNNVANSDGVPCVPAAGMNGCAAGMPMDTEGRNTGVAVKADIVLSARDLFRVGGDAQRYRLNDWWDPSGKGMWPNTFWNINKGERDRLGLFAEWEALWNPQWLTQLGLRHETVDMNTGTVQGYAVAADAEATAFNARDRKKADHNLDLTALARYTPDATRTFEAGYAQKTRSPNLYERFAWSTSGMMMRMVNFAGDGNGYVGNLDLKPEVAHTLSATADWHDAAKENWGLKVTPYYTHVDDYVDAALCTTAACNTSNATPGFRYLKFVNQSARLYGTDVSGFFPLMKTADYGTFTATGVLNYVRGKNRTTGDNLYNIMPLNVKLAVMQRLGNWTTTVEAQAVEAKTNVSQVRNELKTGGYSLLNLRGSYEWKQARLDVGVENLLNKSYSLPLGGAYTGQGKTMSGTGVPWGTPVPGMGRSLYAGLNYKF